MSHPSRFRPNRSATSVVAPRRRAPAGASWIALAIGASSVAFFYGLAGCSGDDKGPSGFETNTATGAGGATGSGNATGMGGDIFMTTSNSTSGTSGSGGAPPDCDGDKTTGDPLFSKSIGSAGSKYVFDAALDAAGNIVVVGSFSGAVDFGGGALSSAGGADVFVAKYDASGTHLWSKRFGGADSQSAKGVALDAAGNVFITGFYLGSIDFGGGAFTKKGCCFEDVFLAKLDSAGNHVWSKGFGDTGADNVAGVAVDSMGNPVIVGQFQSTITFGGAALTAAGQGALDIYVAKFDAAGNHVWSKSFGDAADQSPNAVTIDSGNNVVFTGQSKGTVDFGGGALTAPASNDAAFITKLNAAGAHVWSKIFGSGGASGIALDTNAAGDIVFVGDYKGGIDFGGGTMMSKANDNAFVARLDSAGKYVWGVTFEASASHATGVSFDSKGKVSVAGYFSGAVDLGKNPGIASAGGFDGYVVKLDSGSCHVWSRGFGDTDYQAALGLVVDASDNTIIVGNFKGSADLGTGKLTAVGDDVFMAKYGP